MLGRPTSWLLGIAVVTAPSLLGWLLVGTTIWPELQEPPGDLKLHVSCFVATTVFAIGPFVALLLARRFSDPVHPQAAGAALGAISGAWASVMIDLHCSVSSTAHVALAHVAPIVMYAVAGALIGGRVLGVRAR